MKRFLTPVILSFLLLAGCASEPRMNETASGNPEVTIKRPAEKVKPIILSKMMNMGADLEQDSPYLMTFSRKPTPGQDFAAAMLVGNNYSQNRAIAEFTLFPESGSTRVVGKGYLKANMPFGGVRKEQFNGNNTFNQLQRILNEVKKEAEGK